MTRRRWIPSFRAGTGAQYNWCGGGTYSSTRFLGSDVYVEATTRCGVPQTGAAPYNVSVNELDECCRLHDIDYTNIMFSRGSMPNPLMRDAEKRYADELLLQCTDR